MGLAGCVDVVLGGEDGRREMESVAWDCRSKWVVKEDDGHLRVLVPGRRTGMQLSCTG
jgi:hypothetical protein